MRRQAAAIIDPAIVTARQPYLFTNEDEIGPATHNYNLLLLATANKFNGFLVNYLSTASCQTSN